MTFVRTITVCVSCRTINNTPPCAHEKETCHHKWRAPKRSNDRAWKRIAAGDWLWDDTSIRRSVRRMYRRWGA